MAGLEPALGENPKGILSPLCLPFHHIGHGRTLCEARGFVQKIWKAGEIIFTLRF